MSIRGAIFVGFIAAIWAISVQNAEYFGLPSPWGYLLTIAGAVLIGLSSPSYRRSAA